MDNNRESPECKAFWDFGNTTLVAVGRRLGWNEWWMEKWLQIQNTAQQRLETWTLVGHAKYVFI